MFGHWSVEEGSEHNNRNLRYNREHHAKQTSLQENLLDIFLRDTHTSDPKILRFIEDSIAAKKSDLNLSPEVTNLLENDVSDDSAISLDLADSDE